MTYNNRMIEMTDAEINTYIIDPALAIMTNGGIGSYFMSNSTPTHISGGTWQQVFTFNDTNYANNVVGQTSIWRLTNITAPTSTRPLFWNGSNKLKELDDASLKLLVQRFRNRIGETGVGTYTLQYSPPGYGSWAAVGNSMYDLRSATNVQTYVGGYTGYYTGMYTGYYSGAYAGTYAGDYNLMYGGSVGGTYTGNYTGYYTGSYTGYYPHTYAGTYVGGYNGTTIIGSNDVASSIALWVRRY
jgi:hypothetical protein